MRLAGCERDGAAACRVRAGAVGRSLRRSSSDASARRAASRDWWRDRCDGRGRSVNREVCIIGLARVVHRRRAGTLRAPRIQSNRPPGRLADMPLTPVHRVRYGWLPAGLAVVAAHAARDLRRRRSRRFGIPRRLRGACAGAPTVGLAAMLVAIVLLGVARRAAAVGQHHRGAAPVPRRRGRARSGSCGRDRCRRSTTSRTDTEHCAGARRRSPAGRSQGDQRRGIPGNDARDGSPSVAAFAEHPEPSIFGGDRRRRGFREALDAAKQMGWEIADARQQQGPDRGHRDHRRSSRSRTTS